jgi:glutamate/tyrosine decarboxylase-like PLP-dependent enzyme
MLSASALAESFTSDAHKLMNVPLTASAILVKDHQILSAACGGGGDSYLFHEDDNSAYNFGNKSLQCGRRVDSLKLWLSWKATGSAGYASKLDKLIALRKYMLKKIDETPGLCLLAPANYLNVLFRYEPRQPLSEEQLSRINIAICKSMLKQDLGFVDYAQYKGRLGIRYILANGDLKQRHIDRFLTHCCQAGEAME